MIDRDIFEDLFVLEMANNHWGSLERGLRIVSAFAQVARFNNVRAAIKLQFRDVDSFIHKHFRTRTDIRYIGKTLDTRMTPEDFAILVKAIRQASCIPMATPFDEKSVDLCCELGIPIIKLASSDLNDWILIEKIAATKKPVIVSTGGSSLKDLDDLVLFFQNRHIPLAINHCVSLYPTEDNELELNQIDFLCKRYPANTIGLSTHEYHNWTDSMLIAHIPADGSKATLISLPRDSYVAIPGYGMDRLNAAYKDGYVNASGDRKAKVGAGTNLLRQTIYNLTGLTINHFIQISLLGFVELSDAVGGVTVNLCHAVDDTVAHNKAIGSDGGSGLVLSAGKHSIHGIQALEFVRQRHGLNGGDLDRSARQRYFLTAAFRKVASIGIITKLGQLKVGGGYNLLFDLGCFHAIPQDRRPAYVEGVTTAAAAGADFLLWGFYRPPSRLMNTRVTKEEIEERFSAGWDLVRAWGGEQPDRFAGQWYHMKRR